MQDNIKTEKLCDKCGKPMKEVPARDGSSKYYFCANCDSLIPIVTDLTKEYILKNWFVEKVALPLVKWMAKVLDK